MKIKKILAMILASVMVMACLAIPAAADEPEEESYDLFVALGGDPADGTEWAYQYYGEGSDNKGDLVAVNEKIAVGETKTVSLTAPAEVATTYFVTPVLVAKEGIQQLDFDVKVSIDGKDVTDQLDFEVDAGEDERKWWYEDTGAFKGNCIRLAGGFNTYADERCYIKEAPVFTTIEYTITLNVLSTEAPEGGDPEEGETTEAAESNVPEFDPSSDEYIAHMYIQVDGSWVFRNAWSDESYGGSTDYQYANQLSDVQDSSNPAPHDGTFTDVVLKGNGTYTVTLENPDFTNAKGDAGKRFNLIGVSTNIPYSGFDKLKVTDMTIKVNDSAMLKYTYPEASFDEEGEKAGYLNILGTNIWNDEVCGDCNKVFGVESNWPGTVTKVEVTFTISGFDHDAPAAEPSGDETKAEDQSGENKTEANNNGGSTDNKDDKGGLPTGAIIGIIAGVAVLVVIVIVVVVSGKKKKSN